MFWKNLGLPIPLAMAAAIACGTFAGFVNGLIITRFSVPPLIATLATLALYRGLAEGISQARSVRGYPEWFFFFGQGEVLGVPFQLWILGICTVIAAVILGYTPFGRATYAIGANETAARFSGIRVDATKLWIYTAAGFWPALAAVIFVSRVTTTRSDMGTGLELDVITGVVLGGTSIFGGTGTILGTVLGLILIQALKNGLALSGVKGDGTIVVIGVVLDRRDPRSAHYSTETEAAEFGRTSAAPPACGTEDTIWERTEMKKLTLGVHSQPRPHERIGPCRLRLDRRRRPADQSAGLRRHTGRRRCQAL